MRRIFTIIGVVSAIFICSSCGGGSEEDAGEGQLTERQRRQIEALEALAYVQGDEPARPEKSVTLYDAGRAWPGYNLYSSEHAPCVYLMDMKGKILHRWTLPDSTDEKRARLMVRRARLFENGDLLALVENHSLVRLDRESRVAWTLHENVHHDFDVAADGTIYVLGRKAGLFPELHPDDPILNDYVVVVEPGGRVRKRISLIDALERSSCCERFLPRGRAGDAFHSNTLEILDGRFEGRNRAFRAGNVLTSWRTLDAIGVIDVEAGEVVWALEGPFHKQHHPTFLDSGNLLLFDNVDAARGERASRVIEIDPVSKEVVWEFHATKEFPFYSRTGGTNQPLPNGNVLVTETRGGRAFEVTREGEVVWLFTNPGRVGPERQSMARIFSMQRLSADFPVDWADGND